MATRGTGFINPQTYAAANAGGARAMQDRLTSFLGGQRDAFNNALGAAQQGFNTAVGAGTFQYNPNGLTSAEAAKRAQESGQYTGPESLGQQAGWGGILRQGQQATDSANLGADYYGRQALLQDTYGKGGGYTPGMSRFDSFLAGANGGQGAFQAQKAASQGLVGQATRADTASQAQSTAARTASQANRQRYADAVAPLQAAEEANQRRLRSSIDTYNYSTQRGNIARNRDRKAP